MTSAKKLIAGLLFMGLFAACKKGDMQPTESNDPSVFAKAQKTLITLSREELPDNSAKYVINSITNLETSPTHTTLFTSEKNFYIRSVARGTALDKVFFSYSNGFLGTKKNGIWSISLDGQNLKQILNRTPENDINNIEIDKTNHQIYWIESSNPDYPQLAQSKLMRCSENDGTGLTEIKIMLKGVKLNPGYFTIDEELQRIYFLYYHTTYKFVIGSADFNGNIITPIIAIMNENNLPAKIFLNKNDNRIYFTDAAGGYWLRFFSTEAKMVFSTAFILKNQTVLKNDITAICFDFNNLTPKMYLGQTKEPGSDFSVVRVGNIGINPNDKHVIGSNDEFRTIVGMTGIFSK